MDRCVHISILHSGHSDYTLEHLGDKSQTVKSCVPFCAVPFIHRIAMATYVRAKRLEAIIFLPFPTILRGQRHIRFAILNGKTQTAEKRMQFPLEFQRLEFCH